jgi:hypothetical protein
MRLRLKKRRRSILSLLEFNGKAEPYRTVLRQSREEVWAEYLTASGISIFVG